MISGTAPGRNARGRGNRELPLPFLDYELASASILLFKITVCSFIDIFPN